MELRNVETRKREPLIAGILSIIQPGLGQMYNGRFLKGIFFYIGAFLILYWTAIIKFRYQYYVPYVLLGYHLIAMVEAIVDSKRVKEIVLLKYNKWYYYLLFAIISTLLTGPVYAYFKDNVLGYQLYIVPGNSMIPTLEANEWAMVNTKFSRLERGDVIFLQYPNRMDMTRVVGVENDTIEARHSIVYINGVALNDNINTEDFGPKTVSSNEIFVMGDNRYLSKVSTVKLDIVKSKVLYIYSSNDKKRVGKKIS